MAQTNLRPYAALLYSASTLTTTPTVTAIDFPDDLLAATFILDTGTGTGTSPTLDVSIEVSPDDGTTYYPVLRFSQATTGATKQYITISMKPDYAAGVYGTIAATGGALYQNVCFPKTIAVLPTVGGTNPSYATVKVWVIGERRG